MQMAYRVLVHVVRNPPLIDDTPLEKGLAWLDGRPINSIVDFMESVKLVNLWNRFHERYDPNL